MEKRNLKIRSANRARRNNVLTDCHVGFHVVAVVKFDESQIVHVICEEAEKNGCTSCQLW